MKHSPPKKLIGKINEDNSSCRRCYHRTATLIAIPQREIYNTPTIKKMSKKLLLFVTVIAGLIIPFVPALTIIEVFYLLIPFALAFIVSLVCLLFSLISTGVSTRKTLFIFSILPSFILSQIASGMIVNKIQRLRSEEVIKDVEKIYFETKGLPEQHDTSLGIHYQRFKEKTGFKISYSSGFMVTEIYNSNDKTWESLGWND